MWGAEATRCVRFSSVGHRGDPVRNLVSVSPTPPTFDVSRCGATGGGPFFPLQIGFVEAAGEGRAEAFEEDFLVVIRLRHAADADFVTVLGG